MMTIKRQPLRSCSTAAWLYSVLLMMSVATTQLAHADTEAKYEKTVLYQFDTGTLPNALIEDRDSSVLFGTTSKGGKTKQGSLFSITLNDNKPADYKELYSFGVKGNQPSYYGLIQGKDSRLYGTTDLGGNMANGTIFTYTAESGFRPILFQFAIASSAPLVPGGLIESHDGNFYGITQAGGKDDKGTIFKFTRGIPNPLSIVHQFTGTDGAAPSSLILARNGNYYGTTATGGRYDKGTFFSLTPAGKLTTLYSFTAETNDGFGPQSLVQATDGSFYGTAGGGQESTGTIFHFSEKGELLKPLKIFLDGVTPRSRLIQGDDGYFYGSTQGNSILSYEPKKNTIYRIKPSTTNPAFETLLDDVPASVLIQGHLGHFYGIETSLANPVNTVFKLSPK